MKTACLFQHALGKTAQLESKWDAVKYTDQETKHTAKKNKNKQKTHEFNSYAIW